MKIRKKVLTLFLVLAVTVVFTACGNNQETENPSAETQDHTEETQQEVSADTDSEVSENPEEEDTDSRILVAYYSNTGTTEEVANTIAEHTGADTAEIERTEEYGNLQDEAEAEIENGEHPEITVSVEDITAYDTILKESIIFRAAKKEQLIQKINCSECDSFQLYQVADDSPEYMGIESFSLSLAIVFPCTKRNSKHTFLRQMLKKGMANKPFGERL